MITNIVVTLILLLIAGGSGMYLYKAKKRGQHCVGCPHGKQCRAGSCNCGPTEK